jgi:hypothetical protein
VVRALQSGRRMNKSKKKLSLRRETVRPLTREALRQAAGGAWRTSRPNTTTVLTDTTDIICTAGFAWSCAPQSLVGDCPITPGRSAVCTTD